MIEEIVTKTMRNGIVRFAKDASVGVHSSQLMIYATSNDGLPAYKSLVLGRDPRPVTFNEILSVRVDLLNREAIAAPFIAKSLVRYAEELAVDVKKIRILCWLSLNERRLHLGLYNGAKYVREVDLSDVLGQPTM